MTAFELHRLGMRQLADGYRQSLFSPTRVCEHLLGRIGDARHNCNAFAHVDAGGAMQQARDSSLRWQHGEILGPLDGIPVAIKDVLDVAGMPTRFGSAALADAESAAADCVLAARLRAAGAVLLGKTRTWEFAWRSRVDRDPAEVVRNPANPACSAGGSSGGSVRGPASFCGIFGLIPSQGFIPVYPPSPMGDIEHIGIFARSVADIRVALEQVGGYHPDDPDSWPYRVPLEKPAVDPSRLRFGYSDDLNYADPEPELRASFARVIAALQDSGLRLQPVDVAFCENFDLTDLLFTPDAALSLQPVEKENYALVDPVVVDLAAQARQLSAWQYAQAQLARDDTRRMFNRLFEEIDCLLTLTQETTANPLDREPRIMRLTRPFDMTGQPAVSIPAAVSAEGLPIGIQLVCARGADALLLALAEKIAALLEP